ncbi:MAG: hypothetical protein GY801_29450 [bacterium]|nr:hypothetical protein [bacterium]
MIEETIQIHDKYQFEIKLGYQLAGTKKATVYDIETYLFFPTSLGIDHHSYKKDDFYNDIQGYIRLKTPTVLLKNIVSADRSPIEKLRRSFRQLVSRVDETTSSLYEYQLKMFCCIFKSAVRDHVSFFSAKVNATDIEDLLNKYLEGLQEITRHFRELRSIINLPVIDERLFSIYLFGDEYLSLLIELYTYELLEEMANKHFPTKDKYIGKLLNLIQHELEYRKANNYPSAPDADSQNEEFIFRSGVLKKYMGNVLFLDTHFQREGEVLEQIIFAAAAGVAMLFATIASFLAQSVYTRLSYPFLIALVVSYMLKDRIKELTRGYLGGKMRHFLYDNKINIYCSPSEKIGWCKESFSFIKGRKIPQHIMRLRDREHITEIENGWVGERVILYRKRIKLFHKKIKLIYHDYETNSINDILRVNVLKFLSKMDNPKKYVYVPEGESYRRIPGKRVYHMNMLIKYSLKNMTRYKRLRIVLSRNGIKRIEEVGVDEEYPK